MTAWDVREHNSAVGSFKCLNDDKGTCFYPDRASIVVRKGHFYVEALERERSEPPGILPTDESRVEPLTVRVPDAVIDELAAVDPQFAMILREATKDLPPAEDAADFPTAEGEVIAACTPCKDTWIVTP